MTQRTWLITGVNSGFGRLMAEQLLERGDRVAGTVRKMDAVNDLKAKYTELLWLGHLDMTDLSGIRRVVEKAFADLGRIDVIVSNAGYGLFGAAEELSDEQVAHQLSTNLFGPIQLVRAVLPHLRAQGGGRIIGLSTYGGQAALPGGSLYHASKWGLEGFLDSIAQELAPFKIGVTIIEPGGARTNFRFGGGAAWHTDRSLQGHPGRDGPHNDQRHVAPSIRRSRQDGENHRRQRRSESRAEADRPRQRLLWRDPQGVDGSPFGSRSAERCCFVYRLPGRRAAG